LLHRIVTAQEDERERLARELHDDTLQVLTALSAGLAGAELLVTTAPERAQKHLHELSVMSSHAITELRRLIVALRPAILDDKGLMAALKWYVQSKNQQMPETTIEVLAEDSPCRFSSSVETTLFRITQEALTNIERHAQARHVRIVLRCEDNWVHLRIEDDGRGFDPATVKMVRDESMHGWGIVGMRERVSLAGGHFHIQSAPGQGTKIMIRMPASFPHSSFLEASDDQEHSLIID
jgi:two-component system sensor histidine kinase UhpB